MKTFLAVYIISAILSYFWIRKAFSSNGRWSSITPNIIDIVVVFSPVKNSFISLFWIFLLPYESKRNNINSFFGIKK